MMGNFLIYLYTLPREEQITQVVIISFFFLVLFLFSIFLDFISLKLKKDKNWQWYINIIAFLFHNYIFYILIYIVLNFFILF